MSTVPRDLEERCERAFASHLADGGEDSLHAAYQIGREALGAETGLLSLAALALGVVRRAAARAGTPEDSARLIVAAEGFLPECLAPYELAQRGAREANAALRRLNEVREEELRRVARELHDSAGQLLASAHLALDDVARDVAPEARERLRNVETLLGQAADELRRLSHELRPTVLDDLGLMPALRLLADGVATRSGLAIEVEGSTGGRLLVQVETALYRIVQEALANTAKHARAARAWVRIEREDSLVRSVVIDDGAGFDLDAVMAPGASSGLGLRAIHERADELGGAARIHSVPGQGTEIDVVLPLRSIHADAHPDR